MRNFKVVEHSFRIRADTCALRAGN